MRTFARTLVFSTLAFWAAMPVASAADPSSKKAANDLVRLLIPPESYREMLKQMTDNMVPAMQAQSGGQALPPDFAKKVAAAVEDALPYEDLISWTADLYASRFTTAELNDVLKFYKTPVGRKIAKVLPELMGESGKKIAEILPSRLPQALKKQGLVP